MPNRIGLTDTTFDVFRKLSDGNPGALTVLMEWVKRGPEIDPDAGLAPVIQMCVLDDLDLVGPKIWILYKDICGIDLRRFLGLLRAWQLGFLPERDLKAAVNETRGHASLDVDALLAQVEARLPNFQRAPTEQAV